MQRRRSNGWVWAWVLGGLLLACGGGDGLSPGDVSEPVVWGAADNVTQLKHLYFSGQPDVAGLDAAREAGVTLVLNLREPEEMDWDEKAAVEARGMSYANVPIPRVGPFPPEALTEIETLVKAQQGQPVWLHCSSSNRVGGWLATHLVNAHGKDLESALEVGRRAGITKPEIEAKVRQAVGVDGPS